MRSHRASALSWEVLKSPAALDAVAAEWFSLWSASPSTPFQSPDWLIPFSRHFGSDALRLFVARADDLLVAVAPFYIWKDEAARARKLLLLGSGISDYLDILIRRGYGEAALEALQAFLNGTEDEWDRCELAQIPSQSLLLQLGERCPSIPCLELSLAGRSLSDFASAHQLEKLRYYRRRAAKQGTLQFIRATPENCAGIMEKLFELHGARWADRDEAGVLQNSQLQKFHHEAARRMAQSGTLRLYAAMLNGEVIAVFYGFTSYHRACFYLSGFNPSHKMLSPGTLVIGHAIEEAIREGQHAFDFLRGQESYKYAWGAAERPTFAVSIVNRRSWVSASPSVKESKAGPRAGLAGPIPGRS